MLDFHEQDHVAAYIEQAIAAHAFLRRQTDLSPRNDELNDVLSSFVRATMKKRSTREVRAILAEPRIRAIMPEMQQLAGRAEYAMECFAAAAMLGDVQSKGLEQYASFENFIYRGNYEALIDREIQALRRKGKHPPIDKERQSAAFVGAGPLPMSAILYHQKTGNPVTCIDSDAAACDWGRRLIRHLARHVPGCESLADKIHYAQSAGDQYDYLTHPVVFVASLVDHKDPVLMRIVNSCRTGGRILIRTAEGLSRMLYRPYDCIAGLEEYNVYLLQKTKPTPMTVNTSITYTFPPGKLWRRNKIESEMAAAAAVCNDDLTHLQPVRTRRWRTQAHELVI